MESSPFKNEKRQKRQKALKISIYCVVAAIIFFSGINLITPTYGRYISPQEDKMDVQACFIFPKTIEEYKEKTDKLRWEAEDLMNELMEKMSELEITALNERIDELAKSSNEGHVTGSATDYQADRTTIEGLQAFQSSLQAEISAIESTIAANEQKISYLENTITELENLISAMENLIEHDYQAIKIQSEQKLEEILDLIAHIGEIKDRAIEECDYDPLFFTGILAQMDFNKQVTEKLLQKLEEEQAQLTEQIQKLFEQVTALNDSVTSIHSENVSFAGQISGLTNLIASIDQLINDMAEQIRLAEEKKELEEYEKLMGEMRKVEEIRLNEEIKMLEKENMGSEELDKPDEEGNKEENKVEEEKN